MVMIIFHKRRREEEGKKNKMEEVEERSGHPIPGKRFTSRHLGFCRGRGGRPKRYTCRELNSGLTRGRGV